MRLNTEHLQRYTENDEHHILEHIKKCDECKQHLLKLLRSDNHFIQNEKEKEKEKPREEIQESTIFGKINYKELKEVIILIIIGIIIIFVLDIILRK